MSEWWVVATLSLVLFLLGLAVVGLAWKGRRVSGSHGVIVAAALLFVTLGLVLTSAGQALDDDRVLAPGAALIRGALLVCLVYLLRRYR